MMIFLCHSMICDYSDDISYEDGVLRYTELLFNIETVLEV
jgi:hypothetical protein